MVLNGIHKGICTNTKESKDCVSISFGKGQIPKSNWLRFLKRKDGSVNSRQHMARQDPQ